MKTLKRISPFLLFFVLTAHAYAVDYYWQYGSVVGPTPDSVARSFVTSTYGSSVNYTWRFKEEARWSFDIEGKSYDNRVTRQGSGCTLPSVYNPSTGSCETKEDPCKPTTGQLINHWHKEGDLNKDGTIVNRKGQPSSLCQGACLYDIPASDGCYTYRTAAPSGIFCSYSYRGVGTTCVASAESPEAGVPNR